LYESHLGKEASQRGLALQAHFEGISRLQIKASWRRVDADRKDPDEDVVWRAQLLWRIENGHLKQQVPLAASSSSRCDKYFLETLKIASYRARPSSKMSYDTREVHEGLTVIII
jgi:hypothetical protein